MCSIFFSKITFSRLVIWISQSIELYLASWTVKAMTIILDKATWLVVKKFWESRMFLLHWIVGFSYSIIMSILKMFWACVHSICCEKCICSIWKNIQSVDIIEDEIHWLVDVGWKINVQILNKGKIADDALSMFYITILNNMMYHWMVFRIIW